MTTFVSIGNATQPFDRLINEVMRVAFRLPQPVVIQYGNTPINEEVDSGCITRPFLEMEEFELHMSQARLLILHAGAGSVIHAIRAGKMPVIMPRRAKYGEHVDDHQLEFARALAEMGKAILVEEPMQLSDAIDRALALQHDVLGAGESSPMTQLIKKNLNRVAMERGKA